VVQPAWQFARTDVVTDFDTTCEPERFVFMGRQTSAHAMSAVDSTALRAARTDRARQRELTEFEPPRWSNRE